MLVDRHTKRLDVPGEPGEWVTIRRLTFGELADLRRLSGELFLEGLAGLPEDVLEAQLRVQTQLSEARKAARAAAEEAGEEPEEDLPDPDVLDGMDLLTILRSGVVAWSYHEESGEPVPVEPATVAMLDERTARWLAREIMLLGKAADPLGDSSPSTATSTE
jgi:hypothetical protein